MRVGQAWTPPVVSGMMLFPEQPDLARAFGEQTFTRETHSHGESFGTFADEHDMAGVLHHSLGNSRNILDVPDAAHGPGTAARSVHAAGIEFHHAFFVRKAAEADGIVIRIILRAFHNAHGGVERVAAVFQEDEGVVEVIDAVVGADDDRPFRGAGCLGGAGSIVDNFILNFVVLNYVLRVQILRDQTGDDRCSDCGTQKSTTADGHEFSELETARRITRLANGEPGVPARRNPSTPLRAGSRDALYSTPSPRPPTPSPKSPGRPIRPTTTCPSFA